MLVESYRVVEKEQGRFISRDPAGYVDGMGLYNGYFAMHFAMDPSGKKKWGNSDFVSHYRHGNGVGVTLSQIGLLNDVRSFSTSKNILSKVEKQREKQRIILKKILRKNIKVL